MSFPSKQDSSLSHPTAARSLVGSTLRQTRTTATPTRRCIPDEIGAIEFHYDVTN
jgi:hypothetical protein